MRIAEFALGLSCIISYWRCGAKLAKGRKARPDPNPNPVALGDGYLIIGIGSAIDAISGLARYIHML